MIIAINVHIYNIDNMFEDTYRVLSFSNLHDDLCDSFDSEWCSALVIHQIIANSYC